MLGATIEKNVCLYPNGADPMMTEPELVHIEENACIDSAMLIAHLNTGGNFTLGPLHVERDCVMRTWSRLQQGSTLKPRSMLMEHTLVLPGETVSKKNLLQGWPSNFPKDMLRYGKPRPDTQDTAAASRSNQRTPLLQ